MEQEMYFIIIRSNKKITYKAKKRISIKKIRGKGNQNTNNRHKFTIVGQLSSTIGIV